MKIPVGHIVKNEELGLCYVGLKHLTCLGPQYKGLVVEKKAYIDSCEDLGELTTVNDHALKTFSAVASIKITERPKTCTVEYKGRIHFCRWRNNEHIYNVDGDENLLRGALSAWDGANKFKLTEDELTKRSNGWWSPQ